MIKGGRHRPKGMDMKILIVDDEKISRTILKSKIQGLGECQAVDSSQKALEALELAKTSGAPFDLITLDVSMPGMDGRHMLQHIRRQEIEAKIPKENRVRILMVTARMNMNTIKDCIRLGCNGYLVKPVSRNQLLQNLEKLGFDTKEAVDKAKKDKIQTAAVADLINRFYAGKIALPVFPHVVQEVQELLGRERPPDIDDLARVVKKDIVIASKLISIANSPLYRGMDNVETLSAALLRLGLKTTQGVVSAVAAKNLFDAKNDALKKELDSLWMHSFATASLAKQLAEALGNKDAENIFLMGIIHDIGKMLLMKAYVDMYPEGSITDRKFQLAIHEIHTTFGAVLMKKMRFSKAFVQVAEFHHWNDFEKDADPELLILNLADHLAYEIGFGYLEELAPENNSDKTAEETDFSQKAKSEQKQKDEEKGIDSDLTLTQHEREAALNRLASLPSLELIRMTPEAVLALAEQIQPMIRESAQAF